MSNEEPATLSILCDGSASCGGSLNVKTLGLGVSSGLAQGVAYDAAKHEVFVAVALLPGAAGLIDIVCDGSQICGGSGFQDPYLVKSVSVGNGTNPLSLAYDTALHEVFVVDSGSNSVSVICDGSAVCGGTGYRHPYVVTTLTSVGVILIGAAYDSRYHEVFVTATGTQSSVSVVCDGSKVCGGAGYQDPYIVNRLPFAPPASPWNVAYDSAKHELFVADISSGGLDIICDGSQVCGGQGSYLDAYTVTVSSFPLAPQTGAWGAAYDTAKHEIFVTDENSGSVSVVCDGSSVCGGTGSYHDFTVVNTVSIGSDTGPTGVAYDPVKKEMFVAESGIQGNTPNQVDIIPA